MTLSSRRELTARQLGWLILAYVVVEGASVAARSLGSPVLPPFRLATGIAVVAFALVSRRLLPWMVLGQLGLQFTVLTVFGRISSPLLHLVQASGIVFECAAGGVLYARFSKPSGSSLREVVVVLASALLPAGLVAIPMAAAFNVFVPEMNLAVLPDALDWVTAESVGVMLLVPLVLSPRDLAAAPLSGRQVVGMVTGALLSTVLMGSFFFTQFTVASPALALSFTVFPLFLLAGYVGGLRGAAIGGVLLSGLVTAAAMWVVGPFSIEDTNFARHTFAQVFVVLVTASSLLVGGLTEDERRARRSLAQTLQPLHDSTSRLQALFATAPEATAIFDQAGAVVAVNEAFVTLARRSCGTAPVPGEARGAFEARAGQAWLKANAGGWERALAGDPVVMQLDAHDGAGPLELRFEAVRDASGVVIGVAQRLVDVDAATRDQQRRAW
jgi:PAS domain-containing protein